MEQERNRQLRVSDDERWESWAKAMRDPLFLADVEAMER
jgi:hypothetical protein